ncbi:MAG: molybdopterin cofactor-binding domain-containing protein [Pseudomonadota bacterium]|nr:molybdopterin cofactor-binding domain-containing protein [Pseudomonadota bacterium]
MIDGSREKNSGIGFTLNGQEIYSTAAPFQRLTSVLRDELGLTGTKTGCDAGDCGACTVLMDGQQVCACLVPAAQIQGTKIVTVEGLGGDEISTGLQHAFLHYGSVQCGICTPGMLMAATELLSRNPRPSEAEVEDAIGGVLCRCTGYRQIVLAIADAHNFTDTSDDNHAEGPSVGTRMKRVDGTAKVSGRDVFGADNAPDDALWLRPVRSPHARARFTIGDLDAFRAARPGITAILTAADVPGENRFGINPHIKDQPVFAEGDIRFRGEALLALVGDRAAVEAVTFDELPIDWTVEEPIAGIDEAAGNNAVAVHTAYPDNVLISGALNKGNIGEGFSAATVTVEGTLQTAFVEHAYIEPEAGFARRIGDRIEITACTQSPYMDRDDCARILGLAPEAVRIIPSACGGGFGGKLDLSVQPLLAVGAWTLGKPVRCVYTRIESMASSTKRHPARLQGRAAADAEGNLLAIEMTAEFNTGAYASWGPTVADRVPVHGSGPYFVPNIQMKTRSHFTNEPPSGAFRGFGVPQAVMLQEQLYDDLAAALLMDPFDFRYRNAIRVGQTTATGQVLEASAGLSLCLDALRPKWQTLRREADAANEAGKVLRGVGIGCMWYGCGNTSMSNPSAIRVSLSRKGRLDLFNGAVDIGQGSYTVILQICADALGLPPEAFAQVLGDTDLTPDAGKTSASRQTFVTGKAAYLAGRDLRAQILRLVNAGDGAEIRLEGARLSVRDGDRCTELLLETLPVSDKTGTVLSGEGHFDPPTEPLDENGQGKPYATYGFAAQIADLEVDKDLGTVQLRRIVAAHDVGRAINPSLVEGQIYGGIAQGIGLALMEQYIPAYTENLHDYLIPTVGDVPEIEIILVEDPEPLGPYGAKGIGEPALIPTAPAIFSAIRHATGIKVTQAPLLPHRLFEALQTRDL